MMQEVTGAIVVLVLDVCVSQVVVQPLMMATLLRVPCCENYVTLFSVARCFQHTTMH